MYLETREIKIIERHILPIVEAKIVKSLLTHAIRKVESQKVLKSAKLSP